VIRQKSDLEKELPLHLNTIIMSSFIHEGYFVLFVIITLGMVIGNIKS